MTQLAKMNPRIRALLELVFFIGLVTGLKAILDHYIWKYAGPVALTTGTIALFIYLNATGQGWRSIGLPKLPTVKDKLMQIPKAGLVLLAFIAAVAIALNSGELFGWEFMKEIPETVNDRFGDIHGSLPFLLLWIAIGWVSAAFCEEVMFRGFIITRLTDIFGGKELAVWVAVILGGIFFGFLHFYYQGWRGFITTGLIGIAFGAMFIILKRNLWPIMIVHGLVDTIGFIGTFQGVDI